MKVGEVTMSKKWEVSFEVRKDNNSSLLSRIVEAESESIAIKLAESQLKNSGPAYRREYDWNLRKVVAK